MRRRSKEELKRAEELCDGRGEGQITEKEFIANMSVAFAAHLAAKLNALGDFYLTQKDYLNFVRRVFAAIDRWAESVKRRSLRPSFST